MSHTIFRIFNFKQNKQLLSGQIKPDYLKNTLIRLRAGQLLQLYQFQILSLNKIFVTDLYRLTACFMLQETQRIAMSNESECLLPLMLQ